MGSTRAAAGRLDEAGVVRPDRLVVVVGTGTEVGKTWVATQALATLRAGGVTVAARKPVQSFEPGDALTDAHLLGEATGEHRTTVCRLDRWYEVAMAPPMAARALGRVPFTVADLAGELRWPGGAGPGADAGAAVEVGLVETAGGVRSPLAADGTAIELIGLLQPDVIVLVGDAELGTINSVRLSMDALDRASHIASVIVMLNRYDGVDDLHRRNLDWLTNEDGFDVVTSVPWLVRRLRPVSP